MKKNLLTYSEEQKDIVNTPGDLKIEAIAGSGKSSTLAFHALENRNKTKLYLSFNKDNQTDFEKRIKKHKIPMMEARTINSIAYTHTVQGEGYAFTPYEINIKDIEKFIIERGYESRINEVELKELMNECFYLYNRFVKSDKELTELRNLCSDSFYYSQAKIAGIVEKFIKRVLDRKAPVDYNLSLKLFQLAKAKLSFDIVYVDEAQDVNPCMIDIILNQDAIIILAGDSNQAINGWNGAINALDRFNFPKKRLSKSFRFGPSIANMAKEALKLALPYFPEFKVPEIIGAGKTDKIESFALLSRTNYGLFESLKNSDLRNIYIAGKFDSLIQVEGNKTLYSLHGFLLWDQAGKKGKAPGEFENFKSFNHYEGYARKYNLIPVLSAIRIVKENVDELPNILDNIKSRVVDKRKAKYIFLTVHKSKGLEFDKVVIFNDFNYLTSCISGLIQDPDLPVLWEEINLVYVAFTRAKVEVVHNFSFLPAFEEILSLENEFQKKDPELLFNIA